MSLSSLQEKVGELKRLSNELEASLALEKLWPDVFDRSPVTVRGYGKWINPKTWRGTGHPESILIKSGNQSKIVPWDEVPPILQERHKK